MILQLVLCLTSLLLVVNSGVIDEKFNKTNVCLKESGSRTVKDIRSVAECMTICTSRGRGKQTCSVMAYNSRLKFCYMSFSLEENCSSAIPTYERVKSCLPDHIYNPMSETCFHLVENAMSWDQAHANCQSMGEYLLSFPTAAASQWFRAKANELQAGNSLWGGDIYISGRRRNSDNAFEWRGLTTSEIALNGEPESDWMDGKPNADNKNCMLIRSGDGWLDHYCNNGLPVCEYYA